MTFTSDRPNSPGVTTALYLQRLRSVAEKPRKGHDKLHRFYAFEEGALSVTVPAPPGDYEASIKLVEASTGQTTGLVRVGRVRV
ncbi:MAG: hypothetical protein JST30_14510 [Armatimonadetes bacterium]|nr:hypothetical protein [Armatimonadota bacterium]